MTTLEEKLDVLGRIYSAAIQPRIYDPFHRTKFVIDPIVTFSMGVHFPEELMIRRAGVSQIECRIGESEGSPWIDEHQFWKWVEEGKKGGEERLYGRETETETEKGEGSVWGSSWMDFIVRHGHSRTAFSHTEMRWLWHLRDHPSPLRSPHIRTHFPRALTSLKSLEKLRFLHFALTSCHASSLLEREQQTKRVGMLVNPSFALLSHRRAYFFSDDVEGNNKMCVIDFTFLNRCAGNISFLFSFFNSLKVWK